jgi:hypothetical protein
MDLLHSRKSMAVVNRPPQHPPAIAQVFHAPHIARMSAALSTKFEPILYILQGDEIISNVQFNNPLLGSGWLSAAGEPPLAWPCQPSSYLHMHPHHAISMCVLLVVNVVQR